MSISSFYTPPVSLSRVDQMIVNHEPFAVLAVSTTGLDNTKEGIEDNEVTRACLQYYTYNEKLRMYEELSHFDEMRFTSDPKPLERAMSEEARAKYDVFANGGFSVEEYKEKALPAEEFQKRFSNLLNSIKNQNAVLIINGNNDFSKILEKSGIEISAYREEGSVLYQQNITKDLFMQNGIADPQKCSLERLKAFLAPEKAFSFAKDSEKVEVLRQELKNEMKLEKFSDLTDEQRNKFIEYCSHNSHESGLGMQFNSKEIKATIDDLIKQEQILENKIIGVDNRANEIATFVTWREQNHLYEQEGGKNSLTIWALQKDREDEAIKAQMSEKGKEKYEKADIDEKYNTLIEQGVLNPEKILNGESEYNKLKETILKPETKGICVIHTSTTPTNREKFGRQDYYGEPIEVNALVFKKGEDGLIDSLQGARLQLYIQASKSALDFAEAKKNGTDKYRFDTFAHAGINEEEYKKGEITNENGDRVVVVSMENAIEQLDKFIQVEAKDCMLLEFGNITRPSFANIGNPSILNMDVVDIGQVVKEYSYLTKYSDEIPQNVLFDDEIPNFRFTMDNIAIQMGASSTNTFERAYLGVAITADLIEQIVELEKEKHKDEVKETPAPVPEEEEQKSEPETEIPVSQPIEEEQEVPAPEIEEEEIPEITTEEYLNSPDEIIQEPEYIPDENDFEQEDEIPFGTKTSEEYDKVKQEAENEQQTFNLDDVKDIPKEEQKKEEKQPREIRRRKKPEPQPVVSEKTDTEVTGILAGILDMQQQMLQEMRNDKENVNQQMMLLTSKMTEMVSNQMTAISVLVETNQKAFERCDTIIEQNNALREENKSLKATIEQNGKRIAELEERVDVLVSMKEYELDNSTKEKGQTNTNINR